MHPRDSDMFLGDNAMEICSCLDLGCIHVTLWISFWGNAVLQMIQVQIHEFKAVKIITVYLSWCIPGPVTTSSMGVDITMEEVLICVQDRSYTWSKILIGSYTFTVTVRSGSIKRKENETDTHTELLSLHQLIQIPSQDSYWPDAIIKDTCIWLKIKLVNTAVTLDLWILL